MVEARKAVVPLDKVDRKVKILLNDLSLINKLLVSLDLPTVHDLTEGRKVISAELLASPEKQAHIMHILKDIIVKCAEEAKMPTPYDIRSQVNSLGSSDESPKGSIGAGVRGFLRPRSSGLIDIKAEFAAHNGLDEGMYRSMQTPSSTSDLDDDFGPARVQSLNFSQRRGEPLGTITEEELKRSDNSDDDDDRSSVHSSMKGFVPLVGELQRPLDQQAAVNQDEPNEQVAQVEYAPGIIEEEVPPQIVEEQPAALQNPLQQPLPQDAQAIDEQAEQQEEDALSNMSYDSADMGEQPKTEVLWSYLEEEIGRHTFHKVEARQNRRQ